MLMEPIRRQDAARALVRELQLLLQPAKLLDRQTLPWASVTFTGERHLLTLEVQGQDAEERTALLLRALPEHEFGLRHHFVAEIRGEAEAGAGGAVLLRIEALTIEEA